MQINEVINMIEDFAPPETQEDWDCSGWVIEPKNKDIESKKIFLTLSITEEIINQAKDLGCELLISHHPLFYIPLEFKKDIAIYCAHTNLDKAQGGTTDTIVQLLGFENIQKSGEFLRVIELESEIKLKELVENCKEKLGLKCIKVAQKENCDKIKKIAFCAGSAIDFLQEAEELNADVFITGDIKYHKALDSKITLIDIEHFEGERPVLKTLKKMLENTNTKVIIADEKSPFTIY